MNTYADTTGVELPVTAKRSAVRKVETVDHWKVEQSGRFTVTSSTHERLDAAIESVNGFIAAATDDAQLRQALLASVLIAEPGEPVALPNGKRVELIDLGEQF